MVADGLIEEAARCVETAVAKSGGLETQLVIEAACEQVGLPPRGDMWFMIEGNIVVFLNLSEEACEVTRRCLERGVVRLEPTHWLVLVADGAVITTLPQAKRPPKGGYREPRWIPTGLVLREVDR